MQKNLVPSAPVAGLLLLLGFGLGCAFSLPRSPRPAPALSEIGEITVNYPDPRDPTGPRHTVTLLVDRYTDRGGVVVREYTRPVRDDHPQAWRVGFGELTAYATPAVE